MDGLEWMAEGVVRPANPRRGVGGEEVMARRTEPLRSSCAGRNRKAWGRSEYVDERKGGPDNATTETGGTRDWCRRRFWITSGDTGAGRHGKPVGIRVAVQKKDKKKQSGNLFA